MFRKCPFCGSGRIRKRRNQDRYNNWRCRRCDRVFAHPQTESLPIAALVILAAAIGLLVLAQADLGDTPRQQPIVAEAQNAVQRLGATAEAVIASNTTSASISPPPNAQAAGLEIPPTATPVRSAPEPTPIPTPTPIPPPHLRHLAEKQYMLNLINAERLKAGVQPVELGNNNAAQLHAESALANCFSSHWGIDGLKPYMRYSIAGGYQSNAENGHGSDYCIKAHENYAPIRSIQVEISEAMSGWMDSSGHRRSILDRHFRKVNIGLAWDRYNIAAFQHFEGDYVAYDQPPYISPSSRLFLNGRVKNGAQIGGRDLGISVYYDQPPRTLTRGQVSRTYCYDAGMKVAALREPPPSGSYWATDEFTEIYAPCPDPYDIPADARPAMSHDEAGMLWQEAYIRSRAKKGTQIVVPWITAGRWQVANDTFMVAADLSDVLRKHGDGVYTIVVWGIVDGEDVVISEYSIFVDVA